MWLICLSVCERTPWWVPTNSIQIVATVVEHEFVLRPLDLPLQQWHEVVAIQVSVLKMGPMSTTSAQSEVKLKTQIWFSVSAETANKR